MHVDPDNGEGSDNASVKITVITVITVIHLCHS